MKLDMQIPCEDASGKTIESITHGLSNDQTIIKYTDGAFSVIGVAYGWESSDASTECEDLDINGFGDSQLISIGIVTQQYLDDMRAEAKEKRDKINFECEKRQFEILKKMFGDIS